MHLHLQRPAAWLASSLSRERMPELAAGAVEGLAIAMLAWQIGQLTWTVVTPVTPLGDWQPAPQGTAAVDRTIIGSFDPFFRTAVDEDAAVSSLGLVLSGTRVDQVSGRGSAIIATPDGLQSSYAVGDTIQPGVILTAVGFDSVTISRGGVPEKLFIDQSTGTAAEAPDMRAPGATATTQAGTQLAADVAITPRLQGATLTGYVLTPKGSGAAFAAAGLQPGDVLVSVDGASVTSLKDVAGLTEQLQAGGISISVERGGQPVTLRIGDR